MQAKRVWHTFFGRFLFKPNSHGGKRVDLLVYYFGDLLYAGSFASIITPRHYNTQFNDNQALQIRR
jgi:hypothetical protein